MNTLKVSFLSWVLLLLAQVTSAQAFINYTSSNGLPDDNVMGVAVAYNNHAWFATSSGVAHYNNFTWTVYDSNDGLPDDYIKCVAITPLGKIWVGTDYGVSYFDLINWTNYNTQHGLVDNMVTSIAVEQSGVVWIGTSNGVSKYSNGSFTSYTTANGLPSGMVSYIGIDTANVKWFCTWMGGVAKYNDTTFTIYDTGDGLPDNNITCIAFDDSGNKYLGTYFGVSVLNSQDQWVKDITDEDGLVNDFVQALAVDDNNRLYAGTFIDYLQEGGFTVFDGNQYYQYRAPQGLVSEYIEGLALNKSGDLWIATGLGVSKFLTAQLSIDETANSGMLKAYPNPAADKLWIDIPVEEPVHLMIYDLQGRTALSLTEALPGNGIDVSSLAPGMYLVTFSVDGEVFNSRFIRE
jgi:ligand-binding sensor domain-containing protein